MVILGVILALFATGLVLLCLGLRGSRVDDHPLCRACGFDLAGLESHPRRGRCPECGADVSRESQVRRGNRRPRRVLARAGMAGLVLSVAAGVPVFAALFGGTRMHRYTPTWLLVLEAELRTDPGTDDVLKELLVRHGANPLGTSFLARLGRRATVAQDEDSRRRGTFSPEWRQLLEDPAVRAALPGHLRAGAEGHGASINLAARRRILPGQPLPVRYGLDTDSTFLLAGARAGTTTGLRIEIFDTRGTPVRTINHPVRTQFRTVRTGSRYWTNLAVPLDLPAGQYELRCTGEIIIAATGPNWSLVTTPTDPAIDLTLTQPLEIVGEGVRTVLPVSDDELTAAIASQLTISASTSPYSATQTWVGIGMGVNLATGSAASERLTRWLAEPANMGVYRMVAHRTDGAHPESGPPQRIELGHCTIDYTDSFWSFVSGGVALDGPPPQGVYRLVLTPDAAYAESLIECEQVLDGELTFEGVQIR